MKQKMNRIALLFIYSFFIIVLIGLPGNRPAAALDQQSYKNLKLFNEILDMVQKNYVEPVEQKTLIQGAINGMMKSLDPHSSFMTQDMYKELEVETR